MAAGQPAKRSDQPRLAWAKRKSPKLFKPGAWVHEVNAYCPAMLTPTSYVKEWIPLVPRNNCAEN